MVSDLDPPWTMRPEPSNHDLEEKVDDEVGPAIVGRGCSDSGPRSTTESPPVQARWADMMSEAGSSSAEGRRTFNPMAPPFVPGARCHFVSGTTVVDELAELRICRYFSTRGWCHFGEHCHQRHDINHAPPDMTISNEEGEPTKRSRRGGIKSVKSRAAKRAAEANSDAVSNANFLVQVRQKRVPFTSLEQKDMYMADYLADMCYVQMFKPIKGAYPVSGFSHGFPEHRGKLPEATRALEAWMKLDRGGEGGPMARTTIAAIAWDMLHSGFFWEAFAVLLSDDCYLREQDWYLLRAKHIQVDGHNLSLIMGDSSMGEKVKTGSNQGVVVDSAWLADMLVAIKNELDPDEKVFPITPLIYRRVWHNTTKRLGLEWVGPPHRLRHSRPALDVATGRRGLEDACRRGRWKTPSSIQRYTKTHLLIEHNDKVPDWVKKNGQKVVDDPRGCISAALEASASADQKLYKVVISALRARPTLLCPGAPPFDAKHLDNKTPSATPATGLDGPTRRGK